MKKILALLVAVASFNASAYVEHFDFDVFSDSGDMWVCGASVGEGSQTYYRGGDFMHTTYNGRRYTLSSEHGGTRAIGYQSGNFGFSSDNKYVLSDLDVMLGSERYGSRYSVTLCWEAAWFARGEAANRNHFHTAYTSSTFARVSSADNARYALYSRLAASASWRCQGVNSSTSPAVVTSPSYMISGLANVAPQALRYGSDLSFQNNAGSHHAFTKCTITYNFYETSRGTRAHNQHVEIDTYTSLYRRN